MASDPPLSTEYGNTISSNIQVLARCTTYHVKTVLKAIIGLIEVEGKSTESQNLRYREALDTVEDLNKLGPKNEVFVELEVTILNKLILIYEQQDDAPTVRRFSRRRAKLHHGSSIVPDACYIEHTAQSWIETYEKLPNLLADLSLQAEAPLFVGSTPAFPAQQSALRCGDDDVAKFLCKSDGALQHLDMLKQNPVLAAAAVGKLSLLEKLVQDDKSLLQSRDLFQRTALFHTAYRGDLKTFKTLVQAGANVFDRDEAGQSILGAASAGGNTDVVKWLLQHGGVESPNDHFFGPRSPLHDAARAGHKDVCALLLQNGAYANYVIDNVTPAQAARANDFPDVADMLEHFEADCANQHPLYPSLGAPSSQPQADNILSLEGRQFNSYACQTPLPLEVTFANSGADNNGISEDYQNSLSGSLRAPTDARTDAHPLDKSVTTYDPGRLFGY